MSNSGAKDAAPGSAAMEIDQTKQLGRIGGQPIGTLGLA